MIMPSVTVNAAMYCPTLYLIGRQQAQLINNTRYILVLEQHAAEHSGGDQRTRPEYHVEGQSDVVSQGRVVDDGYQKEDGHHN